MPASACLALLALYRVRRPGLWVAIGNAMSQLRRDRNNPPLGKLCRDTKRPLSRPKHPSPAPNPVATQTTQYSWEPHCDTEIPVVTQSQKALSRTHAALSCSHVCCAHPSRVVRLALEPCRDTGLEKPCRDRIFSIATEDPKWAVALPDPPSPPVFPFSFFSIHPNLYTQ